MRRCAFLLVVLVGLCGDGCASRSNPYKAASATIAASFKLVRAPFISGTRFIVSQGAFGADSHHQKGIEYRWDFDVPYGTQVAAVESGIVIGVREPHQGGGCDPKYSEVPNSILIKHVDGTVAQY